MAVPIKVPSVGESITEGTIARWLKEDGDRVRIDEPVLELETDKATGEIVAPAAGTLRIKAKEGEKVAIGAVVGEVEEGAAPPARAEPRPPRQNEQARPAPRKEEPKPAPAPPPSATPAPPSEVLPASPAARQLAADEGVDVGLVPGTGRGGRVTKEDVLAYLERRPTSRFESALPPEAPAPEPPPQAAPPATTPAGPRGETRQRMSTIR